MKSSKPHASPPKQDPAVYVLGTPTLWVYTTYQPRTQLRRCPARTFTSHTKAPRPALPRRRRVHRPPPLHHHHHHRHRHRHLAAASASR